MVIALIGTMSCNGGKSVDTDTLCAEKVAAADWGGDRYARARL